MTSTRTALNLPRATADRLAALAKARGLPSSAAVIEAIVNEAEASGEIPAGTGGFGIVWDDGGMSVTIAGHTLPSLSGQRAALLASILSGSAGEPCAVTGYQLVAGRPVPVDLGPATLAIGRAGRGIRFVLKPKDGGSPTMFAAPPGLVAQLGRMMHAELTPRP